MKKTDSLGLTLGSIETQDTKGNEKESKGQKAKKNVCFKDDTNFFAIDQIRRNEMEVPLNKNKYEATPRYLKEFRTPNPKKSSNKIII